MKNRIQNKTALITGATSGFGLATAHALAAMQVNLILLGRREERLQALSEELSQQYPKLTIQTLALDVRKYDGVKSELEKIMQQTPVDILINNAGLASGLGSIVDGDLEDWEKMIDTNLKGLLYVSRTVLPKMKERNQGHIINIGSMAGNTTYPNGNVYCATKSAVHTLGQAMNIDLTGTGIRVCTLAPGAANTEFSEVRFHGDRDKADSVYQGFQPLLAEDVADMIVYILNAPAHVNIQKVDMMPTAQRSPYHLHQE
ncbi:SDR family NAD(P)-dependent oxidoreductase [Thiomicrorhabdus xiamenensis]|uniref:SDR family NAD(P)-dependent oxidoreductase n=1 Tax=Thiomicrorhabdus xiamenensis TaxID=2739063 RepID=A0A7D4NNH4_9GAMM|nr:SDR family NAD(P)-dependent oxidoreductase [Thiomicrorhabdus xiamenensis]QKI88733.1 SDR family NAD(P)-dependent oxidoreductase [Thiomicrorhabdus xiamenensis]